MPVMGEPCTVCPARKWAISMLERDFDSPSLRILSGLDGSSLFEADDYFRRVLRELQISEPEAKNFLDAFRQGNVG
jgi:hypothetical protein